MEETVETQTPVVEMRNVHKSFGGVKALHGVSLRLMPGEVLGLVGDNSAGKSTLMKILTGVYHRDAGDILVDDKPVHFKTPLESRNVGIEMIYQDLALCRNLDVSLNMFLGRWLTRGIFLNKRRMDAETGSVLRKLAVDIPSVRLKVDGLSGGRQQSLAIARAISFNPKVIVLDEPTANLSVPAITRVLELMRELKKHNVAQIIISHRLTDVFSIGDRVMVLKRGRNAGERVVSATTEDEVLGLIVRGDQDEQLTRYQPAAP
jgi:simple sugar transport system ATP-binding protein